MSIQSEIDALVKEQSAILSKKIMQVIAKAPVSSLTKLALKPASAPRASAHWPRRVRSAAR